ncbi:Asp-tRNA(Asn)/Glu-tRNA(Gln) amidotransferase subunit GatA [Candidatus Woesearchaeota archaeon]|nr:Asp-tRNA(Asn)/Glu-tRNA(Gln) amidotransferase subunit GatA [Candidatus Woesearchaeota archaeon]
MITEFVKQVHAQNIDIVEHTEKVIAELHKLNEEYHYFTALTPELARQQAKQLARNPHGMLAGIPVSVKDNICVKGVESRAGSRILSGYKPVFHATAVERVIREGGIIVGKTSQDEFGFGGFSTNTGLGFAAPLNPFDKERSCGGSSGGAAGITQKSAFPHLALAESTGGSIVNPASFCGVPALCPTYGLVSRYGLIDYASSLDKIGPMAKQVADIAYALEAIAGFDKNESTSANRQLERYHEYLSLNIKGMKIGIIQESLQEGMEQAVKDRFMDAVVLLESNGAKVKRVSLPTTMKYGLAVYYLLATSEASTNLAKYCGIRYGKGEDLQGNFNEYFSAVRSRHLGFEAKRRILLGTFARMSGFRDAYYLKAAQVRTKIIQEYQKHFKQVDILISPTVPILPPRFADIEKLSLLQNYMIDILTVGPNLAGLPHLSIPVGFKDKLPIGMMLIGNHFAEGKLIQVGSALQ